MDIIDAHLHIFPAGEPWADELARSVGHENSAEHLREAFGELGIVHAVVMGNRSLSPEHHNYPADLFHYCIGLDSSLVTSDRSLVGGAEELVEKNLNRSECCGVKLYPGYNRISLSDPVYSRIYELAAKYDKPVAVHMGITSRAQAHLKYCHPMELDEVAADNPKTRFVLCHFGNPFLETAAAVIEKNPNVAADLSGLLAGRFDVDTYFAEEAAYVTVLRAWLGSCSSWDKIMYGTDWPIVNLSEYVEFIRRVVPEKHHRAVFFDNANSVYGLGL